MTSSAIIKELSHVRETSLQALSVHFAFCIHDTNCFTFHSFGPTPWGERPQDRAPKGNGAKCLKDVCAVADKHKTTIRLWTVIPKLVPYYEGFGFAVTNTRCGLSGEVNYWAMERKPKEI